MFALFISISSFFPSTLAAADFFTSIIHEDLLIQLNSPKFQKPLYLLQKMWRKRLNSGEKMLLPCKPVGHFFQNSSNNTVVFLFLVQLMDLFRATKVPIPQHGSWSKSLHQSWEAPGHKAQAVWDFSYKHTDRLWELALTAWWYVRSARPWICQGIQNAPSGHGWSTVASFMENFGLQGDLQ